MKKNVCNAVGPWWPFSVLLWMAIQKEKKINRFRNEEIIELAKTTEKGKDKNKYKNKFKNKTIIDQTITDKVWKVARNAFT